MMNKREAKAAAEADTTPYAVYKAGRFGASLTHVTGYRNAKIVRGNRPDGSVILTESEIKKLRKGWRP